MVKLDKISKKVGYIIGFRAADAARKEALLFVLSYLRNHFSELEILVVEQDTVSRLELTPSWKIKHIFIYNSGLYNRSWGFNVGAKHTEKEILTFADSDVFIDKADYLKCFAAVEEFDAITPNKSVLTNVAISGKSTHQVHILNHRELYTFAGGMLILTQKAFNKIGGWDERFEGWGGEDNAMSHVVFNSLSTKTFHFPFYHIDHPRSASDTNSQVQYQFNKRLKDEISTFHGTALTRYIDRLKVHSTGNPKKYQNQWKDSKSAAPKILNFVLAITTYNRFQFLKNCVDSFIKTRNVNVSWQIIIADDGSTDETAEYLTQLENELGAVIIRNKRVNIHRQVNSILKKLADLEFDFCFRCDDDVVFLQQGWEKLYWETSQRTGYQHLIFYDKNWRLHANLPQSVKNGELIAHSAPEKIQGAFYTFTPAIIKEVGYFDEQEFGVCGLGHIDFSFRCCRAGFNVLAHPFDVVGSNDFIRLNGQDAYVGAISSKEKKLLNSKENLARKSKLLWMNRVYVPYNENFQSVEKTEDKIKIVQPNFIQSNFNITKYKKIDATFYKNRGLTGFIGFLLKNLYNISLDLKLLFIPKGLKFLGKQLNKISIDLINIGH